MTGFDIALIVNCGGALIFAWTFIILHWREQKAGGRKKK